MKSDTAILGWLSLNGILQALKTLFGWIEPFLSSVLTLSQIAVALATVVLLFYKVKAARRATKSEDNE